MEYDHCKYIQISSSLKWINGVQLLANNFLNKVLHFQQEKWSKECQPLCSNVYALLRTTYI